MRIKNYRLVFAWQGLLAMLLLQAPNILWALWPPATDPLSLNSTAYPILDIIENASIILLMLSFVFIRPKDGALSPGARPLLIAAGASLACYWLLWVLYYCGILHPATLLGMATLPILYYVFLSLRARNYIALPLAVIGAIFHIGITLSNYVL